MNSSFGDDLTEVKAEPEISIDEVKVEEDDPIAEEEFINYEHLKDEDPTNGNVVSNKADIKSTNSNTNQEAIVDLNEESNTNESDSEKSDNIHKIPKFIRHKSDSDPDFDPGSQLDFDSDPGISKYGNISTPTGGRVPLKHYKRTTSKSGCIFKDCDKKPTTPITTTVRRKLLQEYKLYVLRSSEACFEHTRDQNWEELLYCTFKDFSAPEVEDIICLLKQTYESYLDLNNIENVPTRLIRYLMNVNKVQFQRIYERFPLLQSISTSNAAFSMYLMYLQNNDLERMSILLQIPETKIMERVKSVQAVIPCTSYDELNEMFKLEY